MKKRQFLLLFIALFCLSCGGKDKEPINLISDIATDFPTSEKLEFKFFNKYDSLYDGECMIDDSILWHFSDTYLNSVGLCYNLKTGEKISLITTRGVANYELLSVNFHNSKMTDDSILLYAGAAVQSGAGGITAGPKQRKAIKTFAKKDIIENKLVSERKFSVLTIPDSIIYANKFVKLPNGSGLVTIMDLHDGKPSHNEDNIKSKSVAIFNDNEVKSYQTIDYDSFDIKLSRSDITPNYIVKKAYWEGNIEIKDDNIATLSASSQFILYTLNLNNGKVINEKRYTNMLAEKASSHSTNENNIRIVSMRSNNKYIYCVVSGYFSKEDKELEQPKRALFVFDWNLKPIKRFELPDIHYSHRFIISHDCSSIYISEHNEEGLVLTKADLNI